MPRSAGATICLTISLTVSSVATASAASDWRFWNKSDGLAESVVFGLGSDGAGRILVKFGAVPHIAVLDGYHRDTREIEALGFPVFSSGSYAQDQRLRGRVIDFRCPIEFRNAVRVVPGDVIVGDIDGVLVIPAAHLQDVVADALKKVSGEDAVRDMILRGESTEAIYEQTGIM